ANKDVETFNEFADDNLTFTKHLVGYGLLQSSEYGYAFNIEALNVYLSRRHKYERINLTDAEKLEEISRRRNSLEKSLRKIIKNILKATFGKAKSLDKVLSAIPSSRRGSLSSYNIDTILSQESSPLFFLDLINLFRNE